MYTLPPLRAEEIIMYLRKSQADDPLLSVEEVLANHEQMLSGWMERNLPDAGPIPEKNRHREVASGETLDSRPQVLAALKRAESPSIKALLVVEPQRLSRGDLEDIGRLVKLLRYSNTIVITLQYTYDLTDERDRDAFERELKRGNEFLEYQKRILWNGRLLAVKNGYYIGQHAPYGYRRVKALEGKREYTTLEPVPAEAEAVRMIFEWYAAGMGAERIADALADRGIDPPRGDRWAGTTLRSILDNEHYIGMVRWEHKKTIKTVRDGVVVTSRPRAEKYLLFPGKHPAIIDQDLWDQVQAVRGTHPRQKKGSKLVNPFSGLLFCSDCGRAISRHSYMVRGVERAQPRYQCRGQRFCNNASVTEAELVEAVRAVLLETLGDFEVQLDAEPDKALEAHRLTVARLEQKLADLEALEVKQWEAYTLENMPRAVFDTLNKKTLAEKAETQQALGAAREKAPEPVDYKAYTVTLHQVLDLLGQPDAPVPELNALLKTCIERIEYSRPKARAEGTNPRWVTGSPVSLDIRLRI